MTKKMKSLVNKIKKNNKIRFKNMKNFEKCIQSVFIINQIKRSIQENDIKTFKTLIKLQSMSKRKRQIIFKEL